MTDVAPNGSPAAILRSISGLPSADLPRIMPTGRRS
jgi:hypothetical protein